MQPITAAPMIAPRDGLAGAVGYGVVIPDSDPLDPDGRWLNGYEPTTTDPCGFSGWSRLIDVCDDDYDVDDLASDRLWTSDPTEWPFAIGADVECSTFGAPALAASTRLSEPAAGPSASRPV